MSAESGRFQDRLTLVTGASRGIGKAIAEAFASEGAYVIGTGTNNDSARLIDDDLGLRGFGVALELSDELETVEHVLSQAVIRAHRERYPDIEGRAEPMEILVNNAGTKDDDAGVRLTPEQWRKVVTVNLLGTAAVTTWFARQARKVEDARVVTISSVAAMGHGFQTNYAASKGGLNAFMASWPGEQVQRGSGLSSGITFNTIMPGLVNTDIIQTMPADKIAEIVERTPAKRLGTPEDIARAVLFLADRDSSFINGAELVVDGGATAGIHL